MTTYHHNQTVKRNGIEFKIIRIHEVDEDGILYADGWMIDAARGKLYSTMIDPNESIDDAIDSMIADMAEDQGVCPECLGSGLSEYEGSKCRCPDCNGHGFITLR